MEDEPAIEGPSQRAAARPPERGNRTVGGRGEFRMDAHGDGSGFTRAGRGSDHRVETAGSASTRLLHRPSASQEIPMTSDGGMSVRTAPAAAGAAAGAAAVALTEEAAPAAAGAAAGAAAVVLPEEAPPAAAGAAAGAAATAVVLASESTPA